MQSLRNGVRGQSYGAHLAGRAALEGDEVMTAVRGAVLDVDRVAAVPVIERAMDGRQGGSAKLGTERERDRVRHEPFAAEPDVGVLRAVELDACEVGEGREGDVRRQALHADVA